MQTGHEKLNHKQEHIYIYIFFVVSWHVLIFAVIGYNTINIDLIESTSKPQNGSN